MGIGPSLEVGDVAGDTKDVGKVGPVQGLFATGHEIPMDKETDRVSLVRFLFPVFGTVGAPIGRIFLSSLVPCVPSRDRSGMVGLPFKE